MRPDASTDSRETYLAPNKKKKVTNCITYKEREGEEIPGKARQGECIGVNNASGAEQANY